MRATCIGNYSKFQSYIPIKPINTCQAHERCFISTASLELLEKVLKNAATKGGNIAKEILKGGGTQV